MWVYEILNMNFLAHLYLSGDNDHIKVGNFIGDFVKGKKYLDYPDKVSKGIYLHRNIDSFTDHHPLTKKSAEFFRLKYGRYSGIVIDIVYDHFLAQNWHNFSNIKLRDFTRQSHAVLLSNFMLLPTSVKRFLPFLIQNKRLESYSFIEGVRKTLNIMSKYTSLPSESDFAIQMLIENKTQLEANFTSFMPAIISYVEKDFGIKITQPSVGC